MSRKLDGSLIQSGTITTTQLSTVVVNTITSGGGPKVTNVEIANSTYSVLDDTAIDLAGGYIVITGTGFESGATVLIDTTTATSTTFVSSTQLRAQVPAKSAGTYNVYVVNPDGGVGMKVVGLTYSASPIWVTSSTLSNTTNATPFSTNLTATGANNYELASGSSLPPNTSLNIVSANAVFSGNIAVANDTQYTFTVNAIDTENQDSPRTFSLYTVVMMSRNLEGNGILRSDPLSANLIAAYPFTSYKLGNDLSGNSRHATTVGTPVFTTNPSPANSPYKSSYGPGSDANFYTISSSHINMKTLMTLTVECWIYVVSGSAAATILNYWSSQSEGSFGFNTTSRNISSTAYLGYNVTTANNVWEFNTWNHVVYQRYSNTHEIYLNGTRLAQTSSSSYGSGYTTADVLKDRWGGSSGPFPVSNAYIQDLRFYNVRKYENSTYNLENVLPVLQS